MERTDPVVPRLVGTRLATGTRLGPYEIVDLLGAGGMGQVYRARDTRLHREVAVKVLPPWSAADVDAQRRFETEARAVAAINHRNVMTIHDVGTHDGAPYVVCEVVDGKPIAAGMSRARAVDYAHQIATGLAAAHERGIVHRDLKPANLLVTRDGVVKILDFGLAKRLTGPFEGGQSETGAVLGTPGYMSPEQVRAQPIDHRSDLFSLGVVLYEMLAGIHPFPGPSSVERMAATLEREPTAIEGLPPGMARVVEHCLEKDPARRFQNARDLAFALAALTDAPGPSPAPSPARRRRWAWLGAGLGAAAIAAAAAWLSLRSPRAIARQPAVPRFRAVTFRNGTVTSARFSRDGHSIVYSAAWEGAPVELFLARSQGTESRALGLSDTRILAISDGGEMALLRANKGGGAMLVQAALGGGGPRDLAERVVDADWMPDGVGLAAIRRQAGKQWIEMPLGTKLTEGAGPYSSLRVSPDGARVAFFESTAAGHDVVVADRGGRKTTLSAGWLAGGLGGLAWSPRGDEVVFAATRGVSDGPPSLHAVSLSGHERPLLRAPQHLFLRDVLPDGRALVTSGMGKGGMACVAAGQPEERELGWLDYSMAADVSADGGTVVFSELRWGGGAAGSVYLRRTDGSPAVRLGDGVAEGLSPDGKWVLASRRDPNGVAPHLVLLPTGAGSERVLPATPAERLWEADWLPDGKRVVFSRTLRGVVGTFVQDVETGDVRAITAEGVRFVDGSATPDGRFVLAWGATGMKLYPVDGGEPQPVGALQEVDDFYGWSADGAAAFVLASAATLPLRVERLDLKTGRREPWSSVARPSMGVDRLLRFVISGDGRSYCYSYERTLDDLYVIEGLDLAPRAADAR